MEIAIKIEEKFLNFNLGKNLFKYFWSLSYVNRTLTIPVPDSRTYLLRFIFLKRK